MTNKEKADDKENKAWKLTHSNFDGLSKLEQQAVFDEAELLYEEADRLRSIK